MAIYRNVHINFWEDSKVLDDMGIEERYFMLYLLTNPHSNQIGCFEISKTQMINETGFNKEKIDELLNKFENDLKIIIYCQKTKEIFIKNWYKYNWSNSPKVKKCIEKEFMQIKAEVLREEISNLLEKKLKIDTVSIQYPYSMHRVGIKEEEEEEEEQEQEKEKEEEEIVATATPPLNFSLTSILDYGAKKGADEKYCKKFYDYYKKKKITDWQSKFDEWVEKDNIKPNIYELKKVGEGAYML